MTDKPQVTVHREADGDVKVVRPSNPLFRRPELAVPVYEVEWPDGLVLGVVEVESRLLYARYDRTGRRWTFELLQWQLDRISAAWESRDG